MNASDKFEYMRSQTEYSYDDPDNQIMHQSNPEKQVVYNNENVHFSGDVVKQKKIKSNRSSSSESSSYYDSDHSDHHEPNKGRSKKSKYKKAKHQIKHYKHSLSKYKNMCEMQKMKNETLEDKVTNLSKEVESIKRSSMDNFNPAMMYMQKLENFAYATQRTLPDMVSFTL
jgi:predicted RNase H-like nuclease (RuvC/YqgF family)